MTGTAIGSSVPNTGDGRGVTGARQYYASTGLEGPLAGNASPARAIRQAAWTNFRLIVAFVGGTIIERKPNGVSWVMILHD